MALVHYLETLTNDRGDKLSGYYVKLRNGSGYATLASDTSGTPIIAASGVADAALSDEFGTVSLYVANGIYTVDFIASDAITVVRSIADVPLFAYNEASVSEIWAGTDTANYISADKLYDSAAPVTLTDATTIAVDLATGMNFNVTLGGNRTLGNPTNAKIGQSGRIRVTQDATGGRTLAYGSSWKHIGTTPTISTTAGAVNLFAFFVNGATDIELSYIGALV